MDIQSRKAQLLPPALHTKLGRSLGLSEQGFPLRVDIFKLVLPKKQLASMLVFIEQSGLKEHEDFIMYLVAKIEYIYVHDVEFYDQPESSNYSVTD